MKYLIILSSILTVTHSYANCKSDDYKNCFNKTKWGEEIKSCGSVDGDFSKVEMYAFNKKGQPDYKESIINCDNLIKSSISQEHLKEYKWGNKKHSCFAMTAYGALIGRYKHFIPSNDDEKYYTLSKFKKKYGKKFKKSKCDGLDIYEWNSKDFNVLLYTNNENIIARYLHNNTFKELIAALNKSDKKESKQKLKNEVKKYKDMGDDI